MAAFRVLLVASAITGAISQSVKSCGGPNDHLKNPVIKLTPDPIKKGGSLTIEASGTLDEDLTVANSNVDLNIQALGIVHASVKGGLPLSITPGAAKGPFSLTIGPFSLPSNVPGSAVVKGQVHVVNEKSEPIMCIDLDMNIPAMEDEQAVESDPAAAVAPLTAITSCAKPSDHIPDFKIASTGGVMTMTGTLDESVTKAAINLDVSMKVLFITVPLKLNIPLSYTPGLNKGAIKATMGPNTIAVSPDIKATVKGTVAVNDGNGEEITCLNIDTVVASSQDIVV